ncbi:UNVERIFIED_CONTAM: Raucaffricine-O-beta-D-glucosidase [Sesamum calycinum]|uniref:Raucaffricine-O-beta-D-glucosidase n=1 Tax=Sesamum calycinum TaxID=2727403 RepID=A0AAW2JNK9_9LAMI
MMNYIPYRARPHDEQHNQFLKAAAAPNQFSSTGSRQRWDPAKDAYTVARNLLLAHAEAYHAYRNKFEEHQKGYIGIALNALWCEPYKKDDADDIEASKRAMDFGLGWFLEPVLTGQYPKRMRDFVPSENLAPISEREAEMLKGSIDFLGLNYYTAIYAANNPNPGADVQEGYSRDQHVKFSYTDPLGTLIGPQAGSEWLHIYPEGLYKLLIKYVNEQYKDKVPVMYITENGVDEENDYRLTAKDACADSMREDYLKRHLQKLLDAINNDKVNVKGYFAWSWCDNFEWSEGYTVRFGLIYVDYMNYLTRYPKNSAIWERLGLYENAEGVGVATHALQYTERQPYWQLEWKRLPLVGVALQEISGSAVGEWSAKVSAILPFLDVHLVILNVASGQVLLDVAHVLYMVLSSFASCPIFPFLARDREFISNA